MGSKSEKIVPCQDWQRVRIILDTDLKNEDELRLESLREKSEVLQRGWHDNKKDILEKLAAKYLERSVEKVENEAAEVEAIESRKLAERESRVSNAMERLAKEDERYKEIKRAVLLSETLAQREESFKVKEEFERLKKIREEIEETERNKFSMAKAFMAEERIQKSLKTQRTYKEFQRQQMEENAKERQRQKDEALERRRLAEKTSGEAEDKAINDKGIQQTTKNQWKEYFTQAINENRLKSETLQADENSRYHLAHHQNEIHHKRQCDQKDKIHQRILRVGERQKQARDWLQDNVVSKVVDKTDERIAKKLAEEDDQLARQHAEAVRRRREMVEALLKFHHEDQKIKTERRAKMAKEKQEERQKNLNYFDDFLKIVANKKAQREHKIKVFTNFWDDQSAELREKRLAENLLDKSLLEFETMLENATEDDLERYAEQIIHEQVNRGRNIHPIQKARDSLGLGKGPPLLASDASGIRHFHTTKDIFYKPEHSRERLSLTWE